MPQTYDNIKVALTWLEKLRICLQISNELHNNVLPFLNFSRFCQK